MAGNTEIAVPAADRQKPYCVQFRLAEVVLRKTVTENRISRHAAAAIGKRDRSKLGAASIGARSRTQMHRADRGPETVSGNPDRG